MEKFDVTVIGGGPGGYPAAIRAAQLGASTALIERGALGGTCLNWGCIPTKTLIAGSDLFFRMTHSKNLGLNPGEASFDYAAMAQRKKDVVAKLQGGVTQLLQANGVKVFRGTASFVDRNTISVQRISGRKAAAAKPIRTGKTIIATGSTSAMPGFLPESKRVLDSRAFLELEDLPDTLIVLGGGVIGCEFACMAAQLGKKVTVVEMLEDILIMLDPDIRSTLRRHMEKELRISILTGAPLEDIEADNDNVRGRFKEKSLQAGLLLASVGRRPVTDGLNLQMAGLETDETGSLPVDTYCQTRIATIYAVGDVTAGSTQLAHAATSQGIIAAENACRGRPGKTEPVVPACIFTAPEIGCVGLTEQEARNSGRTVKTGKFAFTGLGKAMAAGETAGFVKWIVDADTEQMLGAAAIGAHATELISEAATAIRAELTSEEMGKTIHCHPTFSEAWMEAAHAIHGECIHAPPKRRKT